MQYQLCATYETHQMKLFALASFEANPVWKFNDSRDDCIPVLDDPPTQCGDTPLFIKARFAAADLTAFSGYLIGYPTYYAFGVFVDGYGHTMNLNLPDLITETIQRIAARLDCSELDMFPLRYESEVTHVDGRKIEGVITLKEEMAQ